MAPQAWTFFWPSGRRLNSWLSVLAIVRVPKVDICLETYFGSFKHMSLKSTLLYDPMIKSESPTKDERKWEVNLSSSTPHAQYLLFLMVAMAYISCSFSHHISGKYQIILLVTALHKAFKAFGSVTETNFWIKAHSAPKHSWNIQRAFAWENIQGINNHVSLYPVWNA